ncbi:MAG: GPW/gp25 family protein [bacterium]
MAEREFLGTGWRFPVYIDATGQVGHAKDEEDIRQAIWIILSTAKGERVMRPDFGCGIHDLVFDPINAGTVALVDNSVREALLFFEPRIDVLNIDVSDKEAGQGKLLISIDYLVRATNSEFNLVFPFYLTEGSA